MLNVLLLHFSLVGQRCLILPLYLRVITYMRLGWSTALASLISLPLHSRLPSFIYRLREQGHLRAPPKVHSFFPVSLLIFWEQAETPKQTASPTTCWNPRNESYNACILIRHCLTPAVEKLHLKTQWETCGGTCDTAGGPVGRAKNTKPQHMFYSLCYTGDGFTADFWDLSARWNRLLFSWRSQWFFEKVEGEEWPLTVLLFCAVRYQILHVEE